MFNSYATAYNNIKVNAVSGTLIKSHPKSFFKSISIGYQDAEDIFSSKPFIRTVRSGKTYASSENVVLLQTMLTGNDKRSAIVELVFEDDYLESEK